MIDFKTLSIEGTTRTFTFRTSQGAGELVMRLMSGDNAPFIDDILTRERVAVAKPPTDNEAAPDVALAVVHKPGEMVAGLADQAADLHRWCFESLTIGGEACTREQGLQFLELLATSAVSKFIEIGNALRAESKQEEASSDALAGESSGGSSTSSG